MLHLSSVDFFASEYDDLLAAIHQSDGVHLRVTEPAPADCLRVLLVLATLASEGKEIRIELSAGRKTKACLDSLHRCLLAALARPTGERTARELTATTLVQPDFAVIEPGFQYFVAHTSRLRANGPDTFQADLVQFLKAATIRLSPVVLASLTAISFEAQSNAEEYGYRAADPEVSVPFRVIAIIAHRRHEMIAPLAGGYFREYEEAGYSADTRWLELLVVDAGVGLAYPRYDILAKANEWKTEELYAGDLEIERALLRLVLRKGATTKGKWGRVINRHSAPGTGLKTIKYRLGLARACAIVRAGRCTAYYYEPRISHAPGDTSKLPDYEPSSSEHALFRGTAWQVLMPLDPQLAFKL